MVLEIHSVFIWYTSGHYGGGVSSEGRDVDAMSCWLSGMPKWAKGTARFLDRQNCIRATYDGIKLP